jgi:thiol:disulfide interchange protein DsbG
MPFTRVIKSRLPLLVSALLLFPVLETKAQDALPDLPPAIQTLVDQGAQIRYLGKDFGVEGWVAIKNGQEQFFYVLPGQGAFISGLLVDGKGKVVTIEQVARLRQQGDDILDKLSGNAEDAASEKVAEANKDQYEFKTPSEKLYYDMENSNWIPVGKAGAPMFYAFIDPNCQHCHGLLNEIKEKYIDKGLAQVRIIPVGFTDQSKAQAAFLLAAPDPSGLLWKHLGGDKEALPAKAEINQQGVERNLSIMQSWKFDATPMVVYRGKDTKVKIVKGRPKEVDAVINDLGVRS